MPVNHDAGHRGDFSWRGAREQLAGLPNGGLNMAHEAVTRHAAGARAGLEAIRFIGLDRTTHPMTYLELESQTNRFANVLARLEVGAQDRVFTLAGRIPALYIAAVGTLKARAVFSPLFSAFGPEPIAARMAIGEASVLVTTAALYQRKIAPIRQQLASLRHVLVADDDQPPGTLSLPALLREASKDYEISATEPEDPALIHFTSGTTGKPKGAVHVHQAVVAHAATARFALDLQPGDRYFCTADPGWVTGTSYGIIAPLTIGATLVVDEGEFSAASWYRILEDNQVDVWYTSPTAIRMLMRAGPEAAAPYDLSRVRFAASVGEPLNPEAIAWGKKNLGIEFHDNWWQTETGSILIANDKSMDVRPGSMGKPLPGVEAALLRRKSDDTLEPIDEADIEGELAIATPWPSMFRGYLGENERYDRCFSGRWYLSGDIAKRDSEGYYWFVGRSDDVIKSAGHLIGPFEVESALLEHPAVAEAAVIGVPHEVAMEVVKGFVSLHSGFTESPTLVSDILAHARKRLGPAVAPRTIEIRDDLPKTRSGKIMRRLLKARALGLPEGDTSSMETSA